MSRLNELYLSIIKENSFGLNQKEENWSLNAINILRRTCSRGVSVERGRTDSANTFSNSKHLSRKENIGKCVQPPRYGIE